MKHKPALTRAQLLQHKFRFRPPPATLTRAQLLQHKFRFRPPPPTFTRAQLLQRKFRFQPLLYCAQPLHKLVSVTTAKQRRRGKTGLSLQRTQPSCLLRQEKNRRKVRKFATLDMKKRGLVPAFLFTF